MIYIFLFLLLMAAVGAGMFIGAGLYKGYVFNNLRHAISCAVYKLEDRAHKSLEQLERRQLQHAANALCTLSEELNFWRKATFREAHWEQKLEDAVDALARIQWDDELRYAMKGWIEQYAPLGKEAASDRQGS